MRIDKWLWAAHFYLTRKLATQSVECGRVMVNGAIARPAHLIKPGDTLNFRVIDREWEVVVRAINTNPASLKEAKQMYEETAACRERHIQAVEMKRVGLHRISLQTVIRSRTERQN
ncbi:RNA-binding S4 domain-containing protein [Sulfuritalea sp.]|uniref:RNA-binding S4 domain-containing protein n=1 Tax=Sulfuritalea sp. TaxID=2480090 RepID=UPI001AC86164|nr:RNA-binding S4 domain-containing protein [Sulfuritalea sp.]